MKTQSYRSFKKYAFGQFIIFLLSAEESCYFKVAILGFFFALVLSILPESDLEVKEDPIKVCKNIEKFIIYSASGNSYLQWPKGVGIVFTKEKGLQHSKGLVRSRMIKSSEGQ